MTDCTEMTAQIRVYSFNLCAGCAPVVPNASCADPLHQTAASGPTRRGPSVGGRSAHVVVWQWRGGRGCGRTRSSHDASAPFVPRLPSAVVSASVCRAARDAYSSRSRCRCLRVGFAWLHLLARNQCQVRPHLRYNCCITCGAHF